MLAKPCYKRNKHKHAEDYQDSFKAADNLLLSLNLRRIAQPMDGSCYFHSIVEQLNSRQFNNKNYDSTSLRYGVVDIIKDLYESHPESIASHFIRGEDITSYSERMSLVTEWVDEATIVASSYLLDAGIEIYQIVDGDISIYLSNPLDSEIILKVFYNGWHYDSLESINILP